MQAGIIYSQQEIYLQFKKILHHDDFEFSKGDLEVLVHRLCEHHPDASQDSFLNDDFLNEAGRKLQNEDFPVMKFYRLFILIAVGVQRSEHVQEMLNPSQKSRLRVSLFMSLYPLPRGMKSFLLQVFSNLPLLHRMAETAWRQARSLLFCPFANRVPPLLFGTLPPGTPRPPVSTPPPSVSTGPAPEVRVGELEAQPPTRELQLHQLLKTKGKKA